MEAPALRRAAVIALSQSEEFLITHVRTDIAQGQNHAQGCAGPARHRLAGTTAEGASSGGQGMLHLLQPKRAADGNATGTGFGKEMTFLANLGPL